MNASAAIRRRFGGARVWVTGASSGLGEALAEALADAGATVLASARRLDRLEALAARRPGVFVSRLDLADRVSLAGAAARAWDTLGGIDILINNAGISQRSLFVDSDPAALERVIEVDLLGTMRLTREVAARMALRGSGQIAVVTSIVAKIPTPQRSAYAAAKAGLHGLTDALRGELEPRGITLSLVVPGFVRTEISTHAVTADGSEHGELDPNQAAGASPAAAAEAVLRGLARRRREFTVAMTPKLWLGLALRRVAPALLWRTLARSRVT